jgi:hypothetical protein
LKDEAVIECVQWEKRPKGTMKSFYSISLVLLTQNCQKSKWRGGVRLTLLKEEKKIFRINGYI